MQASKLILVVDDSAAIRALLTAVLAAAGHEVIAVGSVRAALRRLRGLSPALILTDYTMPYLDGHAFVRLLRRDARLAGTPVFVVSSETAPAKRRNIFQAGANGWLAKPIDPLELVMMIEGGGLQAPEPAERSLTATVRRAPVGGKLKAVAHQLLSYVFLLTASFTVNSSSAYILA